VKQMRVMHCYFQLRIFALQLCDYNHQSLPLKCGSTKKCFIKINGSDKDGV
ncbi:hypothetical protein QYM36_003267, partial [Artemia franciscana]